MIAAQKTLIGIIRSALENTMEAIPVGLASYGRSQGRRLNALLTQI